MKNEWLHIVLIFVALFSLAACSQESKNFDFSDLWVDSSLMQAKSEAEFCQILDESFSLNNEFLFVNEDGEVFETKLQELKGSLKTQANLEIKDGALPSWYVNGLGETFANNDVVKKEALDCEDCIGIVDHHMKIADDGTLLSIWRIRKKDNGIYPRPRSYRRIGELPLKLGEAEDLCLEKTNPLIKVSYSPI